MNNSKRIKLNDACIFESQSGGRDRSSSSSSSTSASESGDKFREAMNLLKEYKIDIDTLLSEIDIACRIMTVAKGNEYPYNKQDDYQAQTVIGRTGREIYKRAIPYIIDELNKFKKLNKQVFPAKTAKTKNKSIDSYIKTLTKYINSINKVLNREDDVTKQVKTISSYQKKITGMMHDFINMYDKSNELQGSDELIKSIKAYFKDLLDEVNNIDLDNIALLKKEGRDELILAEKSHRIYKLVK